MTFRLLGASDEERLAFEEASGIKTEGARLIYEASVEEAQALVDKAIREVQEVIGPHGSITRLQSGGVKISRGGGVGVYVDGVLKTNIEPDGDLLVGSDVDDPTTTSFCVFVNEQTYNNEAMGTGDMLIGDNTSGQYTVKFDASEGQLQFRYGTTVKAYMDTDGSIKAGEGDITLDEIGIFIKNNQSSAFSFGDACDNRNLIYLLSTLSNSLVIANIVPSSNGGILLTITQYFITLFTAKTMLQLWMWNKQQLTS